MTPADGLKAEKLARGERLLVIAKTLHETLDSTKPKEPEPPKLRLVDHPEDKA